MSIDEEAVRNQLRLEREVIEQSAAATREKDLQQLEAEEAMRRGGKG